MFVKVSLDTSHVTQIKDPPWNSQNLRRARVKLDATAMCFFRDYWEIIMDGDVALYLYIDLSHLQFGGRSNLSLDSCPLSLPRYGDQRKARQPSVHRQAAKSKEH